MKSWIKPLLVNMSIFSKLTDKVKKTAPTEPQVGATPKAKAPEKKASKPTQVKAVPASKQVSELTTKTLLAPLVTEKSAHLADAGVYAFKVPVSASRIAVSQAFRNLYRVTPVKVNIIRVHGKEHRFGSTMSRRADWKKALVTVAKGTRIDIFEKL